MTEICLFFINNINRETDRAGCTRQHQRFRFLDNNLFGSRFNKILRNYCKCRTYQI